MEIELGPFPRFQDIKSHAYWSRVHLDTRLTPDIDDVEDYKAHMRDCYNHPTTGMLARRKYITAKSMNYPLCAAHNQSLFEMHPEVKELKKSFEKKFKTMYPHSGHIRQYIINHDRVILDGVEPGKKYSFLNKVVIFCKRFV